jgi:hypothetical protein
MDSLTRTVKLLTIELTATSATSDPEWLVRSLLLPSESVPTLQEFKFYYHYLLGLQEYEVRIHERVVPDTFQPALIGSLAMEEPTGWPHMDKTFTTPTDIERYHALLDRVAEIEFMRLNCGVVKESSNISLADRILVEAKAKQAQQTQQAQQTKKAKREDWVRAVLESLNAEAEHDEATTIQESDTIAWILAPLHKDTRNEIGYRILTNMVHGQEWASRVGTALFPDITVCRRIAIVNWRAATKSSHTLAKQILTWYIQTHAPDWDESITPWIVNALYDVDRLLQPFRKIEPKQYTAQDETEVFSAPYILQKIEDGHLFTETPLMEVHLPTETEWMTYIYHILKVATQGFLTFDKCEDFVRSRAQEWIRNRRGLYLEGTPFFPKWGPMWEATMHNRPDVARSKRFELFLNTLELQDPARRFMMREATIKAAAKEWIEVFVHKEIVPDRECKMRILPAPFYEAVSMWICQYIPPVYITEYIKQPVIQKAMATSGYKKEKMTKAESSSIVDPKATSANTRHLFKNCTYRNLDRMNGWLSAKHGQIICKKYEAFVHVIHNSTTLVPSLKGLLSVAQQAQQPQPQQPQPQQPKPETQPPAPSAVLGVGDSIHMGSF